MGRPYAERRHKIRIESADKASGISERGKADRSNSRKVARHAEGRGVWIERVRAAKRARLDALVAKEE